MRIVLGLCAAWLSVSAAYAGPNMSYFAPTDRYAHGVLGDTLEWGGLRIDEAQIVLPQTAVFEDIAPRPIKIGAGRTGALVVESDADQGARLAIYTAQGGDVSLWAATPYIGTRFRWLAPVGAVDLDGDGFLEIAYVDRPHLAQELVITRLVGRRFVELARISAMSNHKIGWDFIASAVWQCGERPAFILPDRTGEWREITLDQGRLYAKPWTHALAALPSDSPKAIERIRNISEGCTSAPN